MEELQAVPCQGWFRDLKLWRVELMGDDACFITFVCDCKVSVNQRRDPYLVFGPAKPLVGKLCDAHGDLCFRAIYGPGADDAK